MLFLKYSWYSLLLKSQKDFIYQKTKKNNNKIINNYTKLSLLNCIIFIVINFVKYFFKSIAIKKYTYTNKKNKSE